MITLAWWQLGLLLVGVFIAGGGVEACVASSALLRQARRNLAELDAFASAARQRISKAESETMAELEALTGDRPVRRAPLN